MQTLLGRKDHVCAGRNLYSDEPEPGELRMSTLHLVPHTHWDREWYLPFQSFRVKLVRLIDRLLEILQADPAFVNFTLDGQTILLDDYLAIRPENEASLIHQVRSGRLHIGPWYVLPDEFLVSPEALVRNLLFGKAICGRFGSSMKVGYLPDPFGHIGQMPQILRGFGINWAAFKRGLSQEGCELDWLAPDGSRVLTAYLRDGYDNAARLPTAVEPFTSAILAARDSLLPHARTNHLLLLNGTDHHEPQPEIPALISSFQHEKDQLLLSSLEEYFQGVENDLAGSELQIPSLQGELRDPARHHLLSGVLSSRIWIKQRNHASEILLERWAEPFNAWCSALAVDFSDRFLWTGHLATPWMRGASSFLDEAWRVLLSCQPHDSICGCSIDQVHEEMKSRFDQVDQIGRVITGQALAAIAEQTSTDSPSPKRARAAIVTFNPHPFVYSGCATATFELPAGLDRFEILDLRGNSVPYRIRSRIVRPLADMDLDRESLESMISMVQDGRVMGLTVQSAAVVDHGDQILLEVVVAEETPPDLESLQITLQALEPFLSADESVPFRLLARFSSRLSLEFVVPAIPGHGYTVLHLVPSANPPPRTERQKGRTIENEFLRVELAQDGSLSLMDLRDGSRFTGLLRFRDQADRGDSYNFCPLEESAAVESPDRVSGCERVLHGCGQMLEYQLLYNIPTSLSEDRTTRCSAMAPLAITVQATLQPGTAALDLKLSVDNQALDHRLQALFDLPFETDEALYDGHYEIRARPTEIPEGTQSWVEQPGYEKPMRNFVAVQNDELGFMVAARGLREAGVLPEGTIAVTLLRCFGWLSRDDLTTRRGGAGPQIPTPLAQSPGMSEFDLRLVPIGEDLMAAVQLAEAFQTTPRGIGQRLHAGALPAEASLLCAEPPGFALTCVKISQDRRAVIVRGVNLLDRDLDVNLESLLPMHSAHLSRLDEVELEALAIEDGHRLALEVSPHQILTLRLTFGTQTR